jgi:hypothetical protein
MRTFIFIGFVSCISLLLSCGRTPSPSGQSSRKSVEQRVTELEQSLDGGSHQPSEAELQKEAEHDLGEIRSMGVVDRALREFGSRFPNATVDSCRISYFVDTNTVWCSIGYRVPGKDELQDDSFGYKRQSGTNWTLLK